MSTRYFQALSSRPFQLGFDRVNLHWPASISAASVHMSVAAVAVLTPSRSTAMRAPAMGLTWM